MQNSLSYTPSNVYQNQQGSSDHIWKIKAIESNDSDINRVLGKLKRANNGSEIPVVTSKQNPNYYKEDN